MKSLADGEVGLIIPGSVYPSLIAKAPTEVGLMNEKQANAWKSTIDYIHSKHSKLFFQICHSGSFSNERKGVSGLIQGSTEMSNADIEEMITTKGKNGTGLGLFMSYSTIRGHFDGNITFESKEGFGTRFDIILPL